MIKTASIMFNVENASTVYLWRSHDWVEGATHEENGRIPNWELVVKCSPLLAPSGYYVHLLQIVDFESTNQFSLPLLNVLKERINVVKFEKFWGESMKKASQDKSIREFRHLLAEIILECAELEKKFDSDIKRLR